MEDMKRRHIPAFGNWDYCDDLPITQYFESARQAGLIRGHYYGEDGDLFKVPVPVKPTYHNHNHHHHHHHHKRGRKGDGEKQQYGKEQQRKQGSLCNVGAQSPKKPRAPKAVDEDLYKIPPELLYEKPKRKRMLTSLWSECLGLNCIA
ncbi:nuclear receptor subfamily 4 group A member 3-like isoform X2 [Phoenix dactylifera]|uniref:Nuclear receptor subfamily 4 group A member 3-like isoform X2 n=1 Tax=Phoenix dactylifera TaxID=42345 RepID=A0A8B7CM54_PHODC|nr:nuclear receptor subfamily 4 group A member 3-like isoform X2 [Phoenix dactylifera]